MKYQIKGFGTEIKIGDQITRTIEYRTKDGEITVSRKKINVDQNEIDFMIKEGLVEEKKRVFDFTDSQKESLIADYKMFGKAVALYHGMAIASSVHFGRNNNNPQPDDEVVTVDPNTMEYHTVKRRSLDKGTPFFDTTYDASEAILAVIKCIK